MKNILIAINLILTTMIAFLGVQLFYEVAFSQVLIYSTETESINNREINIATPRTVKPIKSYRYLAQRNLFNIQSNGERQPEQKILTEVEDIEQTDLDIRLWGTVSGIGKNSYAVIESKMPGQRRAQQQLYEKGDSVLTAKIEKIFRDKVVLIVDDDRQILKLEKYQGFQRRNRRAKAPSPKKPLQYSKTIQHKQIKNAFENLNSVMKQARLRPNARGMSISNIRRNSIFQKLGLKNGDIIVGVNGQKMGSVDDALSLYYSLKSGSKVTIDLERRRRPVTISYAIN